MKHILLHGLGQASSSWNNTVETMNSEFDILCPNLSDWLSNKKPCYSNLYQALETYCAQFSEPLNLCGLSLGGILALQYGIEHPKKVNSLVLIGTQYIMPKRLLQVQNMIFHIMPNFTFQKMGFEKMDFIKLSKSMMDLDFQNDLSKIRCQVLIICGDKDKVNKSASLQLKKMIPHAEISIIANAGHEVNLDNPVELGKELNDFFK
ncbi:alpha/beta hydrolase [Clostridioides difficile]|uniref:alpha/beta fold hydrolase n=1 Tax=Clostridioides difficile TaxID=1496 RepID=UPI00038D3C5A|nr:alpha/beta hydrolase [Clostridioides difficile]EGT3735174.1 alpha/beta fold hydrolase [Clostridioides difficile]EGT3769087.1 alpha/beta fold hydrolase [Clostridioides difficile]EGT4107703.1 alpha/beta fold hydrolase [Clostridioides difficile]EGT4112941.1 alpha/beta fold hydrolase [Clostridioides difficile]EGT4148202.1 alpha/beta fold hydrolase [Clostridioides difficile]